MTTRKKWTDADDKIIVMSVKKCPTNLAEAFRLAGKKLGRSKESCTNRWYKTISKNPANACFITVSGKHHSLNRKNSAGVKCTNSLFMKILKLLGIKK